MDYSLSGEDMERVLSAEGIRANISTYTDAVKHNIDHLLSRGAGVLCFETRPKYGHWIACWRNHEGLNWFDSYGIYPDDETHWNFDPEFKRAALEDRPRMLAMLYEEHLRTGEPVVYNDVQLQEHKPGVATCGRHVCVRLSNWDLSCDEYIDLITAACKKHSVSPDELVVMATRPYMRGTPSVAGF